MAIKSMKPYSWYNLIGVILTPLGFLAIILGNLSGVGYFLYLLGPGDLTFGMAAWGGFSLWLKIVGGGLISLVIGYITLNL